MKKTAVIMITLFLISTYLIGCTDNQVQPQQKKKELFEYEEITPMSEDIKTRVLTLCYEKYVRDEYPDQTVADLKIDYDMGNRNGNYVFIFSDGREYDDDPSHNEKEIIKSIPYHYFDEEYYWDVSYYYQKGRPMRVYNNGAVYGFTEAFERGLLSESDMEYFMQCHSFVVQGKRMQKRMDWNVENSLMTYIAGISNHNGNSSGNYYCKYNVIIKHYLGTYRGNVVFAMSLGLESAVSHANQSIEIDGVTIRMKSWFPLCVYNGSELFILENNELPPGFFTTEELLLIAEKAGSAELPIYNNSLLP